MSPHKGVESGGCGGGVSNILGFKMYECRDCKLQAKYTPLGILDMTQWHKTHISRLRDFASYSKLCEVTQVSSQDH